MSSKKLFFDRVSMTKGLTKQEEDELLDLIHSIDIVECFGSRDLMRRYNLEDKATNTQFRRIYGKLGYPKWQIDKMLDA